MGENPLLIIGLVAAVGMALNFARMWLFVSAVGGNARAKASRIANLDSHLSFDERIAQRMHELEKERSDAAPAPTAPPQGFGRRQG